VSSLLARFRILSRVRFGMALLRKTRCIFLLRRISRTLLPGFSGKVFRLFCCILEQPTGRHFDLTTVYLSTIFCFQVETYPGLSSPYRAKSPLVISSTTIGKRTSTSAVSGTLWIFPTWEKKARKKEIGKERKKSKVGLKKFIGRI